MWLNQGDKIDLTESRIEIIWNDLAHTPQIHLRTLHALHHTFDAVSESRSKHAHCVLNQTTNTGIPYIKMYPWSSVHCAHKEWWVESSNCDNTAWCGAVHACALLLVFYTCAYLSVHICFCPVGYSPYTGMYGWFHASSDCPWILKLTYILSQHYISYAHTVDRDRWNRCQMSCSWHKFRNLLKCLFRSIPTLMSRR